MHVCKFCTEFTDILFLSGIQVTQFMNTLIWGPPTWRFLHGTSFLNTPALVTVVQTLAHVLPCSHCRESYAEFVDQMDIAHIADIVAANKYAFWMYTLHNKVSSKLLRKKVESLRLSASQQDELVAVTTLPYSALKQRLMMSACSPYFSINDVMIMLGVFAYAAKELDETTRQQHFLNFARAVALLLQAMDVPTYAELGARLQTALATVTPSNFATSIFDALLNAEGNPATTRDYCSILSLARAQTCANGICK